MLSVLRETQEMQGAQGREALLAGETQKGFREEVAFELSLEGR